MQLALRVSITWMGNPHVEMRGMADQSRSRPKSLPRLVEVSHEILLCRGDRGFDTWNFLDGAARADWRESVYGNVASIPQNPKYVSKRNRRRTARTTRRRTAKSTRRRSRPVRISSRRRAVRRVARGRTLSGLASYYWQPQRVASGGWFNPNALTAAHIRHCHSVPGFALQILRNGRSVVVRINDRGPYIRGRIIDLSRRAGIDRCACAAPVLCRSG